MNEDIESFARGFVRSIVNSETGEITLDNASASMLISGRIITISINSKRPRHLAKMKPDMKNKIANCIPENGVSSRVIANRLKIEIDEAESVLAEMIKDGVVSTIKSKRLYRGDRVVKYVMASNVSA